MCTLLLLAAAAAAPLQLRVLAGAQIDPQSHGEFDFGVRSGPWSAELYTDTLQLAWNPSFTRGRAWASFRAEGAVAGLMPTPWADGAPDPARARYASYLSPEVGVMAYAPGGTGFGARATAHVFFFAPTDTTTAAVPGPTFVETLETVGGWWYGPFALNWRGGVDYSAGLDAPLSAVVGDEVSPHVAAELTWRPHTFVAPRVELRAGAAQGQGEVLRTRLGGDMPYQVPLAGAGWSEFWVEDYAAARVGLAVGSADASPGSGVGAETSAPPEDARVRARALAFADLATFDDTTGWGVGARLELRRKRAWGQLELGWAGGIPRQEGVSPFAVLVRLGLDWTELGAARHPSTRPVPPDV